VEHLSSKTKRRTVSDKKRLYAAVTKVASENPKFRKALMAELKTARTEFSDVARQVGQKLKARAIPVPFNRVKELKNYRDPRLDLDTEAPPVAYLIKDIEYVEGTMMTDSEGAPGDLEVIIDAILVPCVVKSNGRKAMLVLTYDGQSNPLSSQAYDEDYDIEPYKVSDVVGMIEGAASGVAWADEQANMRAASKQAGMSRPGPFIEISGKIWRITRFQPHGGGRAPDTRTIGELGWGEIKKVTKKGETTGRGKEVRFFKPPKISVETGRGKYLSQTYKDLGKTMPGLKSAELKTAGRSLLPPPVFTTNERPYFKGPGLQALRAMEKKETPKWGHLANAIKGFEKYEALRQKPGWEDPEQLDIIRFGLSKLRGYMKVEYPTGKPKPKRKRTPLKIFLDEMKDPGIQAAVRKVLPFFKGHPAEAAQFADDVMEDANFHRESRYLDAPTADYSLLPGNAPNAQNIAGMLHHDNRVLSFAAALVSAAGSKRDAAAIARSMAKNVPIYHED
jgi:hypothetical protein